MRPSARPSASSPCAPSAFADRPAAGRPRALLPAGGAGGSHTLRGFRTFRFRGEKVLLLQAEYRWEAWPALEFALFADAGRAFGAGEDFALDAASRPTTASACA